MRGDETIKCGRRKEADMARVILSFSKSSSSHTQAATTTTSASIPTTEVSTAQAQAQPSPSLEDSWSHRHDRDYDDDYNDQEEQGQPGRGQDITSIVHHRHSLSSIHSRPTTCQLSAPILPSSPLHLHSQKSRRRPIPIQPCHSSSTFTGRHSPYLIPLPLSSARSTMTSHLDPRVQEVDPLLRPTTPPRRTHSRQDSGNGSKIASPTGSMSMSRRRQPPAWPSLPRKLSGDGKVDGRLSSHQSHRVLIARNASRTPGTLQPSPALARSYGMRSAGQSSGYHLPPGFRVPPTPQWSPAYRSSHPHQHPQHPQCLHPYPRPHYATSPSLPNPPHSPYRSRPPQTPSHTPGLTPGPTPGPTPGHLYYRGISAPSSAPLLSAHPSRLPDRPIPPSPGQIAPTAGGTIQYRNVSHAWVVGELQRNAPNVWYHPETTDCRISK